MAPGPPPPPPPNLKLKTVPKRPVPDFGRYDFVKQSSPNADNTPPSPYPEDILIDPYGTYYCFVCQVPVPRGPHNLSQHVHGRRHEVNNERFVCDPALKHSVRRHVLAQIDDARATMARSPRNPAGPAASPPSAAAATAAAAAAASAEAASAAAAAAAAALAAATSATAPQQPSAAPAPLSTRPRQTAKRPDAAEKARDAARMKSVTIDKEAFLAELIGDAMSDAGSASPAARARAKSSAEGAVTETDSENERDDEGELAYERRHGLFTPIKYQPPPGPDLFFDAMAGETEPTPMAKRVRTLFAEHKEKVAAAKADTDTTHPQSNDGAAAAASSAAAEQTAAPNNPAKRSRARGPADFIPMTAKSRKVAPPTASPIDVDDLVLLYDENGERLPPWLLDKTATENVLNASDSHVALHFEILEFARFATPTAVENQSRREMIMTIESITKNLWPASTIGIFGSYATGLCLPASDVDICVLGTPAGGTQDEFHQLAEAVRNVSGFARNVQVVKAKVSLVKVIARSTSVNCDISIGVDNGPKNVPVIKRYIEQYPALRPLVLVIKCFMQQRGLNDVFTGSLGSYCIFLLVLSHLQMLRYNFPQCGANLGSALITFLQLYGRNFNMCFSGVRVKNGGCYFDKYAKYRPTPNETIRYCVEDPNDETNEIGRSSFFAWKVRRALGMAGNMMERWRRADLSFSPTPLGVIINVDLMFLVRRSRVIEDLERQGKKPLRETVSGKPLSAEVQKRIADANKRSSQQASPHGGPGGGGQGQGRTGQSPGRPAQTERDPRKLAKRRRSEAGLDNAEPDGAVARNGGPSGAPFHGRHGGGNSMYAPNSASGAVQPTFDVDAGAMDTAGRAPQHNYATMPVGPMAATPGYQYAGGGAFANGAMPVPMPDEVQLVGAYPGGVANGRGSGVNAGASAYRAGASSYSGGRGGRGKRGFRRGGSRG